MRDHVSRTAGCDGGEQKHHRFPTRADAPEKGRQIRGAGVSRQNVELRHQCATPGGPSIPLIDVCADLISLLTADTSTPGSLPIAIHSQWSVGTYVPVCMPMVLPVLLCVCTIECCGVCVTE